MIILASSSPRRAELLTQIGVPFEKYQADINETPLKDEEPEAYVVRLAIEKAEAIARVQGPGRGLAVLGADTAVVSGGEILGKPRDYEHYRAMMVKLAGHSHQVMSAIALITTDGRILSALSVSNVLFRPLQEAEIEAYWHSGEPFDKAGGYAIQGRGAIFIEHIEGSYSGVMGLPLFETAQLLQQVGISGLNIDEDSKP